MIFPQSLLIVKLEARKLSDARDSSAPTWNCFQKKIRIKTTSRDYLIKTCLLEMQEISSTDDMPDVLRSHPIAVYLEEFDRYPWRV